MTLDTPLKVCYTIGRLNIGAPCAGKGNRVNETTTTTATATPTPANTQEHLKRIIAANIAALRRQNGMTQADLAARLNYSDKAISKWERGESIPDITVLKSIADLFSVTVDYLLVSEHETPREAGEESETAIRRRNRRTCCVVTAIAVVLVWLVAMVLFVVFQMVNIWKHDWMVFLYALPASLIVWLVMNTVWFDHKLNYPIISGIMWSILLAIYISVWQLDISQVWMIFLLGIPGQAIIILWSRLKKRDKPTPGRIPE